MKPITYFKGKLWNKIPSIVCGNLCNKYQNNYSDYYHIVIFDNYNDMYDYADRYFGEKIEHDYSGICKYSSKVYFEDGKYIDKDKCCGWILLCKGYLGAGTVAHECTHAVNYYFTYRITKHNKIFTTKEYDELFAYMIGSLVNQIYRKIYDKKVL